MSNTSQAGNRINSLLDENSFVEIGAGVTARATDFNMNPKDAKADGVVTGYGLIDGKPVYVYSQDASVLGGSIGEMHAKKITKLYDLALKTGAPVVGIIDSTGIRLQESSDALSALSYIFKKMSLASGVIPQITAILGTCGGSLSLLAQMSDFVVMEDKKAKMFVNSPNALTSNYEEKLDTASAKFQAEAGNVDIVCDEASVYDNVRTLVSMLPSNNEEYGSAEECTDDLNRVCTNIAGYGGDTASMLSMIADNNLFIETKKDYAKSMVTGFIKLDGQTIGCVANRSEITSDDGKTEKLDTFLTPGGCYKAAEFIEFCDSFDIPILSLSAGRGFAACVECEKRIANASAKLTYAFANATVPKVNVIVGELYGAAFAIMNSKALGADMTFAWDNASVGTMDAKLAAKIIADGKSADDVKACEDEYAKLNSIDSAARRGYVDTVIAADDTRKYVIGAYEMLFTKREDRPLKKHGAI